MPKSNYIILFCFSFCSNTCLHRTLNVLISNIFCFISTIGSVDDTSSRWGWWRLQLQTTGQHQDKEDVLVSYFNWRAFTINAILFPKHSYRIIVPYLHVALEHYSVCALIRHQQFVVFLILLARTYFVM